MSIREIVKIEREEMSTIPNTPQAPNHTYVQVEQKHNQAESKENQAFVDIEKKYKKLKEKREKMEQR